MDTIFLYSQKKLHNAAGIAINIFLAICFVQLFSVPILANDLIANITVPNFDTGQINEKFIQEKTNEIRKLEFDEKIKKKYPNAVITDIDIGIKHIKYTKYYDKKPVKINIVEIDKILANNYELKPKLASTETLNSKKNISAIAKETNSIIALNGTFFKPETGVPLGTLMINGKLLTGPVYDRAAFGVFNEGYDVARIKLDAKLISANNTIVIDNINQPRMLATYTLCYTPEWGKFTPASPEYGTQIIIKNNKITAITDKSTEIPKNGYVIVAPKLKVKNLKIGDKVELSVKTNPKWSNAKHIISGGPYLVKNGEVYIDMTAEKLGAIGGKNPRSAIGYTKDNILILVAIDGREGSSVGMTLVQLADLMKSLGCIGAINLDGGSSTVMYVNGKIVNNPHNTGGIPISNAIVLSKKL